MKRILRLATVGFAVCNGYHLISSAARLAGAHALRDATKFDPSVLDALIAEYEATPAS